MGKGGGECGRQPLSLSGSNAPDVLQGTHGKITRVGRDLTIRFDEFEIRAVGRVDLPIEDVDVRVAEDGGVTQSSGMMLVHLDGGSLLSADGAQLLQAGTYVMTSRSLTRMQAATEAELHDPVDDTLICWHDLTTSQMLALRHGVRLADESPGGWFGRGELASAMREDGWDGESDDLERILSELRRIRALGLGDNDQLHRVRSTGRRLVYKADHPLEDRDRWDSLTSEQQQTLQATWFEQIDNEHGDADEGSITAKVARPFWNSPAPTDEQFAAAEAQVAAGLEDLERLGFVERITYSGWSQWKLTRPGYEVLASS